MKIGLIADMHLGYSRGTREDEQGVNVREQDVLDAAQAAVDNLWDAKVEAIVDLGDMFHVPAPKKRALLHAVQMIKRSAVPWYSANGNHTLQRTKSDLHIYDVLSELCSNFYGCIEPTLLFEMGAYLIPYGQEVQALRSIPPDAKFLAGHFACDDVPFPGEHVSVKDLPDLPTFLGHYHTRKEGIRGPTYIGATERFAWGEADNPTGVAVYDTNTQLIEFIDHETREWVDVTTDSERIFDDLKGIDFEGKIVRVNVTASPSEYHALDTKAIRDMAKGSLEFAVRRIGQSEQLASSEHQDTQTYSLLDAWREHMAHVKMMQQLRGTVVTIGEKALASAGVGE